MSLALWAHPGAAPPQAANVTRSPHGNLSVPCQNCHTASGWKPIRAVPEFDHNQTKYPLRGMHQSVACTQCHVKPVFNNVGQRCQDCHADIHRRQMGANCEQCHTVRGWQVTVQQIQDHNNRFPLTGAHAVVDCDACHKSGAASQFQGLSTACYSCHQADYLNTNNPNHPASKFAVTCDTCHSTDNWLNAKFDHNTTGFLLTGMHAVPPRQCVDCHIGNNYNLTNTACVSCHLTDFQKTNNPSHVAANFPTTCEQCHVTTGWTPATFDHSTVNFPLTGQHTVPPRQCTDCHVNGNYNLTSTACVSCHLKDFQGATNPNHVSGGFAQTCDTCHTTSAWEPATFDHSKTAFPLTGSHAVPPRQCTDCHANNNYNITNTACVSCHQTDYNNATTPVAHAAANFPTTCEQCHDTVQWTDGTFNHNSTGFTLTGQHTVPPRACTDCHTNSNYSLNSTACVSCHLKDYQGTSNPNHVTQNFPQTCEQCHSTTNWTTGTFDHSTTGFPLTGAHTVPPRACTDCHLNSNYNITNTACVSCHQTDYNNATTPVAHAAANFPTTCEQCHDTVQWTDGTFNHNSTGFTLTGQHTVPPRACTDCHTNGNYNLNSTACVSCHLKDYQTTTNPNHVTGNFPQTCDQCHGTATWSSAAFDHNSTGFPLTGAHTVPPRACTDCHVNNSYTITNTACVSCHQADYNNATSPVAHASAGFPTTCEQCHDTVQWTDGTFNHASTGFTLTGQHTVPPRVCSDCHVNNNYTLNSTACVSCHLKDYQGTTNPNHVSQNLPQTCDQCHSTATWSNAAFDHSTTGFPLTGSHTVPPRACTDCHANNNYTITNTACVSCHQTDYNNATSPVAHASAGFPTTCEQCHDTVQWTDGTFNHNSTGFTLTGQHTVPPRVCSDCHVNNNYTLNSTTCVSCHLKDYQTTTNPNHVTANFPQTCEQCHSTTNWTSATFDHSTTGFPLTGSHTVPPRQCSDCHVNNNYTISSTACVSCHQTDYNNATTPVAHASAGLPTTCDQCHDTVAWTDGKFDHSTTGFTLTGQHTVPPRQCTDCHTNNNYSLNSTACVSCHLKDYQTTTNPNHVTANFPQTCEQCHSTANWTSATFNHASTGFTLTGSHTVPPRACTDCHVNNNYNITNTTCVSCHQADYNTATTPVAHASAGLPTTCDQCHDTVAWTDGKFDHSTTGFTLTGQHTVPPRQCTDCHTNNNYSLNSTACVSCHLKDYQTTTNPNHVTANFPQTCDQCHSTANWTSATFNHTSTGFTLTGSHTVPPRACTDCHVNNNYNITNTTCVSCHQADYNTATTPVAHAAAGFPTTCDQCHDTVAWTDGTFNHTSTGFTLTGSHTVPPRLCTDCHTNNNYNITTTTCVSCHQKDYTNATTPVNHVAAGFPTTCDTCHDTVQWTDATFNHTTTGFTLTGAHTVPPRVCADCHVNNNYTLNSTACVTCHLTDYNGTTNPNHSTSGFPQQCDLCHDTTVWTDSTFNHSNTAFPLTGSHTVPPRQCTDCHVNGNYTTLPTTCVGCHQTDYNNTTNPGHAAQPQYFPTTCSTCHTTTAWTGATFNHSQYTRLSTNHGNAGGVCSTCHTNSNDYSVFTCTSCHGGNNAANFHHENVSGYVYNSINCYQCHPSGND